MTVKQLKAKHKRERRNRKVKMVKNGIGFLIMVILMMGFVELGLRAWESEMDAHAEYNRNYIQQMEKERAK